MKVKLTKKQAINEFKQVLSEYPDQSIKDDKIALREAWNCFTDRLHRDGYITDYQVNNWTNPF